jgi:hypothetical protein
MIHRYARGSGVRVISYWGHAASANRPEAPRPTARHLRGDYGVVLRHLNLIKERRETFRDRFLVGSVFHPEPLTNCQQPCSPRIAFGCSTHRVPR